MSAAKTVIHNAQALVGGQLVANSWISFSETINAIGTGDGWNEHSAGATVIDAEGQVLSPGLIDTHVHGGGGFAAEEGQAAMQGLIDFHKSQGTTSLILSLVSNPLNKMIELLKDAKKVAAAETALIGVHLEGPFLSHTHKGAHNPDALQQPTVESLQNLIAAGGGLVKSITLAPELFNQECIKVLVDAGVTICVGHTNADFDIATRAFESYAKVLTHAFNGMKGIHHRAPGPVVAALNTNGVWLELIADGVHVDKSVTTVLKPEKVILVTDAMAAAGQADGSYMLGALPVKVEGGIARTVNQDGSAGSIAGSTLTMPKAVANYASWAGSAAAALNAATANPASAYNLAGLGVLEVGAKANLILWSTQLSPQQIFSA